MSGESRVHSWDEEARLDEQKQRPACGLHLGLNTAWRIEVIQL